MAGFIDRILGSGKTPGQAGSGGAPAAKPARMTTGKLIGAGGEGAVYEDRDDGSMVIKVMHSQHGTPERAAKLQTMCENPPPNWQTLSWPNAVEADENGLRYRMPKAPRDAGTAYRFISANERRQLPKPCQSYQYRSRIGVNIAEALRGLHATHVRIGDVNPSNILVDDDGAVTLIDCDSFQIPGPPGRQPYPCVVGSPEYTAPEIDDFQRQFRSQDSDNFALAVLLYQLLGNGSHPYQGIDATQNDAISNIRERIKQHRFAHQPMGGRWKPTPGQARSWRAMPAPVRDAFRQAFSPGAAQIGRPAADAWAIILGKNPDPAPSGQGRNMQPSGPGSHAPPAWQVGPEKPAVSPNQGFGQVPSPAPPSLPPIQPQAAAHSSAPAMERQCPHCKSRNARTRRDWYRRRNALRCLSCNGVFGKTIIKRCPGCGSQDARLRSDWYNRGRPFRCSRCNAVFGGTDQTPPRQPVVGGTPNLVSYLTESTAGGTSADGLMDRARGVMLGVAVGNLLGLPVEGRSRQRIQELYPAGVRDIEPAEASRQMDDDPAQAVELAESLLERGDLIKRFAARLVTWRNVNGRGMGRFTRQSIAQLADRVPPSVASYAVFRARGGTASNGGIMRCAPVAVARRRLPERLVRDTADTCAVSHYAPACQWSCVIINVVAAVLVSGNVPDLKRVLSAARADGCPDLMADAQASGVPTGMLDAAAAGNASPRDLFWMRGNRGPKGHTVLTLQAGLWAATTPLNFEEALIALVNAGGDSDTNGALAGAVLGARYGESAIPLRWTGYVPQKDRLADLGERLARL